MKAFVKTAILNNQPNWSNREALEGEIVVQGLKVFIVIKDEGFDQPSDPVLEYNVELGKWVDGNGQKWDEWSIEEDEWFE